MSIARFANQWLHGIRDDDLPEVAETRSLQMAAFARHTPINSLVSMSLSLFAVVSLWHGGRYGFILPWAGLIWAIGLWHLFKWWRRRDTPKPRRVSGRGVRRAVLWALLGGLLWGSTVFLYPQASDTQRLLLMIMGMGVAAGAATTLGAVPVAAAAFIAAAVVPWIGLFLVQLDLDYFALACMALVFMLAMLSSTRVVYASFLESVKARQANAAQLAQFHSERDEWFEISDTAEAFALFDDQDRLLLWNENYRRILSLPPETLFRGAERRQLLQGCAAPVEVVEGRLTREQWVERHLRLQDETDLSLIEQLSNGRWLKSSARRTSLDHTVTLHVDVTALKSQESALIESEARFKAFLDHAPVELGIKDLEGRYVFVSREFERVQGIPNHEVQGKRVGDIYDRQVAEALQAHDEEVMRSERASQREVLVTNDDGTRTFLTVKFPIRDADGAVSGIGAVATDITERKRAEQELEASRALLADAVEALADGFIIADADERLVVCNSRYREIYSEIAEQLVPGITMEHMARLTGRHCLGIVGEENVEAWIQDRMERRRNPAGPFELHLKNGRWIRVRDDHLPNGWIVGIRTDITELKERQKALEESEKRFQDFAESSADWFWEMDADLRFTYLSPNVERNIGVSPESHYGKTRAEMLDEAFDRDAWDGHLRTMRAHEPFRDFVYPRAVEGVELCWMRTSGVPVFAGDGAFLGYRGSASDVTSAVEAERALRASEEQLRLVTDSLPVLIAYCDRNETYLFVNKTCAEWYGLPRDEIIGKSAKSLRPDVYAKIKPRVMTALKGHRITYELTDTYGDGKTRDVRIHYVPRFDEAGEVEGFFVLAEDVSESTRAAAQLRDLQRELEHVSRLSAMGHLSSALAHELNQPLTAVMNYNQAARRLLSANGEIPPKVEEMIDKATTQAGRAGDVIRRLRGLFERGETETSLESINEVVEDAASLALLDADSQGISYKLKLKVGLPPVMIDKIQVQQVVLNLVRNAVEALAEASRRELEIETSSQDGGVVEVAVCDSGPGLPPEIEKRMFEPFVTGKHGNMGVGLSISNRIVEAHGGRLWAEANAGGGTRFRFTLPSSKRGDRKHGG